MQTPEERPGSARPRTEFAGLGIPLAIAAVVFMAALLIFSAAGPDRTRTADNSNQPSAVTTPAPSTPERAPTTAPVPTRPNQPGIQ
jgi:hypothetical protein